MNKDYVRLLLEDGAGKLQALLEDILADPEFSEIDLSIQLNEVYGSLNWAWNGRNLTTEEISNISEDEHYRLRSFPITDIIMDGS